MSLRHHTQWQIHGRAAGRGGRFQSGTFSITVESFRDNISDAMVTISNDRQLNILH